jgi:hypothetical protein
MDPTFRELPPTQEQVASVELEVEMRPSGHALPSASIWAIHRQMNLVVGDLQLIPQADNGFSIGFVQLRTTPLPPPWWAALVKPFGWRHTAINWRGHDIGERLVKEAVNLAKEQNADFICGDITSTRSESQPWLPAWYRKLGFTISDPRPGAIKYSVLSLRMDLQQD